MITGEQQRFFTPVPEATQASAKERCAVDLGLCFLSALTTEEALTVLEERRDLLVGVRALMKGQQVNEPTWDEMQFLIQDHIQTLLVAELT